MIITAKFSSTCPKCGQYIDVGSKVEWSKGAKAVHVKCPTGVASSSPKPSVQKAAPSSVSTATAAPYVRREKWEPCKRVHLPNTVGDVRVVGAFRRSWATLREGATGEPVVEGDALVVVAQEAFYESAEQNEDMGDMSGPGWQVTLYLRRATVEEAAPALALADAAKVRTAAKARRDAAVVTLKRLDGWISSDSDADVAWRGCANSSLVEVDPGVSGSGRYQARLSTDGSTVAVYCGGYYDDYRPTLRVSVDPTVVAAYRVLAVAL